jgi:hypothetical protein
MRVRHTSHLILSTVLGLCLAAGMTRAADEQQYPLSAGKLQLAGGTTAASRRINFSGRWAGTIAAMPNPVFAGTTLRVIGGASEGDSGLIRLPGGNWKALPKGKGYIYTDKQARAGGIRSIQLRITKGGGRVKILGGTDRWAYHVTKPQSTVTVSLVSGAARWCAQFTAPKTSKKGKVTAKFSAPAASCPCDTFASTWEAIQNTVFARNSCAQSACHDAARSGGLDLRPENAYGNLVGAQSLFGVTRVEPYSPQDSFLWQKLAAAQSPPEFDLQGKGSPMPQGLPPISKDELNAIRQWILKGAPQDGVVPDTESLLNACLPKPEPPADEPLAVPATAEGTQFHAPPWEIPPRNAQGQNGENEVCYSTYYNLTGQVPAQFLVDCPPGIFDGPTNPTKKCFTYNHQLLRQSANSHHSIIHVYNGVYPANDAGWGYQCSGGTVPDGTACDPTVPGVAAPAGADCGGGFCRGKVVKTVACTFGYGPPDFEGSVLGNGNAVAPSFSGSQQPRFERVNPAGAFSILPVEGTIVWNSHAFNVYDQPIFNQQWLNLWFTNDLRYPVQGIFDASDIFVQHVLPFQEVEYCRTVLFGKGTRIADFSSHTHKRGRLFRVWGPGIAQPCRSTQTNPGACLPESSAPIMVTTEYNDPAQLVFKTPLALDGDDPASRRFKFCSIYDNGHTDPAAVKRNTTSPVALVGGKCFGSPPRPGQTIYCANRKNADGSPISCNGDDRACDSAPGANDGVCDACTLTGGVSTEDEMFILIGSYYCETSVPGETCTGVCSTGPAAGQSCSATGCPNPGACLARPNGTMQCRSGEHRGENCASDADCPAGCISYSNS